MSLYVEYKCWYLQNFTQVRNFIFLSFLLKLVVLIVLWYVIMCRKFQIIIIGILSVRTKIVLYLYVVKCCFQVFRDRFVQVFPCSCLSSFCCSHLKARLNVHSMSQSVTIKVDCIGSCYGTPLRMQWWICCSMLSVQENGGQYLLCATFSRTTTFQVVLAGIMLLEPKCCFNVAV